MAKDYIFPVRMDPKEKETFFRLVASAGYDNAAEYARQKLLVGEDMKAIEDFTANLEKAAGWFLLLKVGRMPQALKKSGRVLLP